MSNYQLNVPGTTVDNSQFVVVFKLFDLSLKIIQKGDWRHQFHSTFDLLKASQKN